MNRKPATASNPGDRPVEACRDCAAYKSCFCHAIMCIAEAGENDGGAAAIAYQDQTIAARRAICRENETLDGVPFICKGWAATAVALSDGRRQILSFLLPGDIVSAILIFDPVSRCSIEAVTELQVRTLARDDIKAALLRHPDLMDMISDIRDHEVARAAQLSIDLGRRTAIERIAQLILQLSERLARCGLMHDGVMDFPLRQHHIADATGLTVVHAGNILADFRRGGLIEISGRSLKLADPDGLRRIAGAL